jgi:hypothetical protein
LSVRVHSALLVPRPSCTNDDVVASDAQPTEGAEVRVPPCEIHGVDGDRSHRA